MTALTLVAFAANSLLCRGALVDGATGAATFTAVRIASGAVVLGLLARARRTPGRDGNGGRWDAALALVAYAAFFSFAYRMIPAGVGALVLFASVQLAMLAWAVTSGEGPRGQQWVGVLLALGGLAWLAAPGATRLGEPSGLLLMAGSGVAWGVYSLLGRRSRDPVGATAGNFLRASLPALALLALSASLGDVRAAPKGLLLAVLSGAVASGLGYVLWYTVLPRLGATRGAVVQLAVPAIAAFGGVVILGEVLTPRLLLAGAAILGGIALVTLARPSAAPASAPPTAFRCTDT